MIHYLCQIQGVRYYEIVYWKLALFSFLEWKSISIMITIRKLITKTIKFI